jgi:hypothetical protein
MTSKEKAREIVIKMQFQKEPLMFDQAKQCALIAVDEIMKSQYKVLSGVKPSFYDYWAEVGLEIKKL